MNARRDITNYTQTQNKDMNKNAYEIRLDLLNLAHGDMTNRFYEKLNVLREADNRAYDSYIRDVEKNGNTLPFKAGCTAEKIDELLPSRAEIITRAEQLYRFIEGK